MAYKDNKNLGLNKAIFFCLALLIAMPFGAFGVDSTPKVITLQVYQNNGLLEASDCMLAPTNPEGKDCLKQSIESNSLKIVLNPKEDVCKDSSITVKCHRNTKTLNWNELNNTNGTYEIRFSTSSNDNPSHPETPQFTTKNITVSMLDGDKNLTEDELKKCTADISNPNCIKWDSSHPTVIQYNPDNTNCNVTAHVILSCNGYDGQISYPKATNYAPSQIILTKSDNFGDKIKDRLDKFGTNVKNTFNSAKDTVTGLFRKADPCSATADKDVKDKNPCPAGKCEGSLVEKTKLDTKQSGTDGENNKAGKCVIAKCIKGYVKSDNNTKCEQSEGECDATKVDENATAGELKKGKCIITECGYGYHLSDKGDKCEQSELSEEGSQERITDLQKNADAMKEKENSWANKTLTAASMGATGIGGMQLMQGLAEQRSDEDAERDMKAYLATFTCDFGQGRNIKGGDTNVQLPGGNALLAQYQEYIALAQDLKERKESLGMRAGIESELVIDKATTGLYDDVGVGKTGGAYTSLYRALTDENSEDAAAWAKQKADAAQKVKTGAIVAGAGVIGGIAGNLAINSGKDKQNKVDEIMHSDKYAKFKAAVGNLPKRKCEDYEYNGKKLTGAYDECDCNDPKAYFSTEEGCVPCKGETVPKDGACVCKNGNTPDTSGNCTNPEPCKLSGDFVNAENCACDGDAIENFAHNGCECTGQKKYNDNGTCKTCAYDLTQGQCLSPAEKNSQKAPTSPKENTEKENDDPIESDTLPIPADDFFIAGWAEFTDNRSADDVFNALKADLHDKAVSSYYACVTGQTDPSGFKNTKKNNIDLSAARAYRVASALNEIDFAGVQYKGLGAPKQASVKSEDHCQPNTPKTWANCRRMNITFSTDQCGDGFENTSTPPKNYKLYLQNN